MKKQYFVLALLFSFQLVHAQTGSAKYSFGIKVFGSGKPMILIPGLKGDGEGTFATTVAHYKDRYKCYVITLAGFAGQPAAKRDSLLLQGQRDEIIQFVKDAHLQKPVLVAFSFGGSLGLWIESTAPDLFGKLVDIDGTPFDDGIDNPQLNIDSLKDTVQKKYVRVLMLSESRIAKMDSIYHSPESTKEGFEYLKKLVADTAKIPEILDWDAKSDFRAQWLMILEGEVLDLRNDVAKIKEPILVLGSWIGWDNLKTKEDVQHAYETQFAKAKNCKIVFSDHGKHFLMWDDYDWYIKEIDDFLK